MIQIIDTLFNTLLNRIQKTMETSNERERGFTHESVGLLNYNFQRIDIIRAELYIILHQRDWKESAQENNSIALNILFLSYNSEEVKLVNKSIYNKRKNQVILLMINDETNNYYYFAVKTLSELNSLGWLRAKKRSNN